VKDNFDSGICDECEWEGLFTDAEVDYEYDEFRRINIPYLICPKCGGGIDNYYDSKNN
jgi:hypothetical protein